MKVRKHCRGSIARLKGILENYPTFSRTDEVYWALGEANVMCGAPMQAMPYYKELIEKYPSSDFKNEYILICRKCRIYLLWNICDK